jgi:hypothetical protein
MDNIKTQLAADQRKKIRKTRSLADELGIFRLRVFGQTNSIQFFAPLSIIIFF